MDQAFLNLDDVRGKMELCRVLRHSTDPNAVDHLIELAGDIKGRVRAAAILALGSRREPRALPLIIARMHDDPIEVVRQTGVLALDFYDGLEVTSDLMTVLDDPSDQVVSFAVSSLRTSVTDEVAAKLKTIIERTTWSLRLNVCQVLIESGYAYPDLLRCLEELAASPDRVLVEQAKVQLDSLLGDAGETGELSPEELIALVQIQLDVKE